MTDEIQKILHRDLGRLRNEIAAFKDESNLWKTEGTITNSAGNIALHLIGNLNHYIGSEFGNTGYVRDRKSEFGLKNVPRTKILSQIEETQAMISDVLPGISHEILYYEFPDQIFGHPMTNRFFLIHLSGHLMYHLGQVNYLRRVVEN